MTIHADSVDIGGCGGGSTQIEISVSSFGDNNVTSLSAASAYDQRVGADMSSSQGLRPGLASASRYGPSASVTVNPTMPGTLVWNFTVNYTFASYNIYNTRRVETGHATFTTNQSVECLPDEEHQAPNTACDGYFCPGG